jgi:hypothetical protein
MATSAATDPATAFIKAHTKVCTTDEDIEIILVGECPLCLDAYVDEPPLRITGIEGCNHVFGEHCLRLLLNKYPRAEKKCPLCRTVWIQGHDQQDPRARRNAVDHGPPLSSLFPPLSRLSPDSNSLAQLIDSATRDGRERIDRARRHAARAGLPSAPSQPAEVINISDDSDDSMECLDGVPSPAQPRMRVRRRARLNDDLEIENASAALLPALGPPSRPQAQPHFNRPEQIRLGREGQGDINITAASVAAERRQIDDLRARAARTRSQINRFPCRAGSRHAEPGAQDQQSKSDPVTGATGGDEASTAAAAGEKNRLDPLSRLLGGFSSTSPGAQPSQDENANTNTNANAQSILHGGGPRVFATPVTRARNSGRQGQTEGAMENNNNSADVRMAPEPTVSEPPSNRFAQHLSRFSGFLDTSTSGPSRFPSAFQEFLEAMEQDANTRAGAQGQEQAGQTGTQDGLPGLHASMLTENRSMQFTWQDDANRTRDAVERNHRLRLKEANLNSREVGLIAREAELIKREIELTRRETNLNRMMETVNRHATERDNANKKQREELDKVMKDT